jgi:DNA (cytosine-5)-methyltransferase 1
MIFRLGELFCGPGGLALGALRASVKRKGEKLKITHAFATDYDEHACNTYARNICKGNKTGVICEDVRRLDLSILPDIDALAFGFPCNDFSIVGEQNGLNGNFGPLYAYGKKVLDLKKPKFFIAENVGGLSSANGGNALRLILDKLSGAGPGYEITAHLYKFEEYGVPQRRHRIVIVGIDKRENLRFRVPAPTTLHQPVTARKALECPPIPHDAANNEMTRQSKTVVERLNHIPEGKNAWHKGIPKRLRLNVKGAFISQIYKRLAADEPAYTVTGSGGGGTHVYHWKEPRALTNRERARLQTFPDDFVFEGQKEQVRKQIGMAVPPLAAQLISEAILKTFAGIDYPSIEAHWDIEPEERENVAC